MGTGFTYKIGEGISFEDFVLDCSRAFIHQYRDADRSIDPSDVIKPPSSHYADSLAKEKALLKRYESMTIAEAEVEAEKSHRKSLKENESLIAEKLELKKKYEAMLEKVNAWKVPTPMHQGIKDFMVKQIVESIEFDCSTKYNETSPKMSGKQWKKLFIDSSKKSIKYYTEQQKKEQKNYEASKKWVTELKNSLKNSNQPKEKK